MAGDEFNGDTPAQTQTEWQAQTAQNRCGKIRIAEYVEEAVSFQLSYTTATSTYETQCE